MQELLPVEHLEMTIKWLNMFSNDESVKLCDDY